MNKNSILFLFIDGFLSMKSYHLIKPSTITAVDTKQLGAYRVY